MKVLVACEESQRVCIAFRARGHEAYSCDILPCSGGRPEWHIQGDVMNVINDHWDLMIAHPPCTYLTTTGNRWFNVEKYGDAAVKRAELRKEAIEFFERLYYADIDKICIENPVGVMSSVLRKPDQYIQPYYFGEPYEKRTGLWLKNLPLLKPTNMVTPEPRHQFASGKSMGLWMLATWNAPREERSRIRSKTFPGIAAAMAEQWG